MENRVFKISPAPHIHKGNTVNKIMLDFIIALLPVVGAGIYFYENDAIRIILTAVIACLASEMIWNKLVKKGQFITDLSPIVTGILLGVVMPTHLPIWIVIVASVFAIIVVKQFFGGLGQNFMNPVAAAKAFLIASWAGVMAKPVVDSVASASGETEAVASASGAVVEQTVSLLDQFIGTGTGNIGEVSILAIVIGGLYLALRGRINLRAPFTFIIVSFAMYASFGKEGLIPGSFFLAAIFMSTDYATSPMTRIGQYIFGIGLGVIASFIAVKGFNPEGPYYAIILMNLCAPLIEYFTTKKFKKEVA